MEDGQPTSTPTPCKMGCGFFVSLRYSSRFFPFVFPRRRPDMGCRRKCQTVTFPCHELLAPRTPGPRNSEAFRGPSLPLAEGGKAMLTAEAVQYTQGSRREGTFPNSGRSLSVIRGSGRTSSPSFRADSSYSQHGTDRAWGRVERVSPQPLRGDQKEGYGRRIGQGSWRVGLGALDSIHSFRSFSFAAAPHKSLSFVGQALKFLI